MKRRTLRRHKGQALVEFAIIFGLLVIVVIGGIQMLYTVYVTRNVRAAAEDAVQVAAIHGGDTDAFREQLPFILETYRLDPEMAEVEINPPQGAYLQPLTVRVNYPQVVRVYGLFDITISAQEATALSQRDYTPNP